MKRYFVSQLFRTFVLNFWPPANYLLYKTTFLYLIFHFSDIFLTKKKKLNKGYSEEDIKNTVFRHTDEKKKKKGTNYRSKIETGGKWFSIKWTEERGLKGVNERWNESIAWLKMAHKRNCSFGNPISTQTGLNASR